MSKPRRGTNYNRHHLYYLFVPQATDYSAEYETGWEITDIFQTSSIGIVTARDKLTIHWTAEDVRETVSDFVSLSVDEARKKYNLGKDSRDWKVHLAQADLRNHHDIRNSILNLFTTVHLTHAGPTITGQSRVDFIVCPRPENMPHLLTGEPCSLCLPHRQKSCMATRFDNR